MTAREIAAYVAEVERRFRARTPATDIEAVVAVTRVGRSEMRRWFLEAFGREMSFDDEVQALRQPMAKLYRRLRREFPHEVWT